MVESANKDGVSSILSDLVHSGFVRKLAYLDGINYQTSSEKNNH